MLKRTGLIFLTAAVMLNTFVPSALAKSKKRSSSEDAMGTLAATTQQSKGPIKTDRVIVKLKGGSKSSTKKTLKAIQEHDYTEIDDSERTYSVKLDGDETVSQAISELSNMSGVEYVEPDYIRTAQVYSTSTSADADYNWGVKYVGADKLAKKIKRPAKGIVVAVVDSGVNANHELLKDHLVQGYDFIDEDKDPDDLYGHGTHVAGIVANTVQNLPIKIMPVRVIGSDGYGYDSNIAKGIKYAVDHGASVINLSLGQHGESKALTEAVQYAVKKNVVVVVAAGNDHINVSDIYPAAIPEAITVSAIDKDGKIAGFSNFGYGIDLSAPGVDIGSSYIGGKDSYINMNGTSMAAPFVSALAAMLKAENKSYKVDEIEAKLKSNTKGEGHSFDPELGFGTMNLAGYDKSDKSVILNTTYFLREGTPELVINNLGYKTSSVGVTVNGRDLKDINFSKNGSYRVPVDSEYVSDCDVCEVRIKVQDQEMSWDIISRDPSSLNISTDFGDGPPIDYSVFSRTPDGPVFVADKLSLDRSVTFDTTWYQDDYRDLFIIVSLDDYEGNMYSFIRDVGLNDSVELKVEDLVKLKLTSPKDSGDKTFFALPYIDGVMLPYNIRVITSASNLNYYLDKGTYDFGVSSEGAKIPYILISNKFKVKSNASIDLSKVKSHTVTFNTSALDLHGGHQDDLVVRILDSAGCYQDKIFQFARSGKLLLSPGAYKFQLEQLDEQSSHGSVKFYDHLLVTPDQVSVDKNIEVPFGGNLYSKLVLSNTQLSSSNPILSGVHTVVDSFGNYAPQYVNNAADYPITVTIRSNNGSRPISVSVTKNFYIDLAPYNLAPGEYTLEHGGVYEVPAGIPQNAITNFTIN
ncbi:S8 family serine peptidase [Brevibacillus fluminis]|uniref:S8 family serine peptidase n=1 Tax=Brevibacillus fluminis TaxID=511487 RepID=UPI003F88F10C